MPPEAASTPARPPALLARLKAETAPLHARIEQVVPLLRPGLDRRGYRDYLARLFGYLGPLEVALQRFAAAFAEDGVDLVARDKSELLAQDLLVLGASAAELLDLPRCRALPATPSLAEAWGCLYVLEGSTLGGQVIQRTLGPRLSLSPGAGLRFLCGYGERTGSTWKEFAAALGRFEQRGGDGAAVLRGAAETFATLMAWLAHEAPALAAAASASGA
jgi:heme oxygenase